MIKMTSLRPLYINGVTSTSFEVTNAYAKELERKGLATRDEPGEDTSGGGAGDDTIEGAGSDLSALVSGKAPTIEDVRIAPNNRDNFEREPVRGAPKKKK
jgi:hypothetical protein